MNSTPDPTGAALYAAILAHPDEDTPRLAYADHIEEFGDSPRAEFIRLQCQLATMNEWDEGHTAAEIRCRRRIAEHPEWADAVRKFHPELVEQAGSLMDNPRGPQSVFVRGFPGIVSADAAWFALQHGRLFGTFPIRNVGFRLEDAESRDSLVGCPGLSRLSGLGVSTWSYTRDALAAVARLKYATALKRLEVYTEAVHADALEDLLNATQFATLEAFALWSDSREDDEYGRTPEDTIRALARSSWLFGLRELRLDGEVFAALCQRLGQDVAWTPRLTRLAVRGWLGESGRVGPSLLAAVKAGLQKGWFAAVEDLDLGFCQFGGLVCEALAASGRRLARLALPTRYRNAARTDYMPPPKVFASDWLSELRALSAPRANDAETAALLASGLPQRLRVLDLSNGVMNAERLLEVLGVPGGWPCLESLDLSGNPFSDDALAELVRWLDRFPRLVSLTVGGNPSPRFIAALAQAPEAAQLRELYLYGPLRGGSAAALAASPYLGDIDLLRVEHDGNSAADRDWLQARFGPRVTIDDSIPF